MWLPSYSAFVFIIGAWNPYHHHTWSNVQKQVELMFEKLLTKLGEYKKIKRSVADQIKFAFSHFMSTLVKENRDEILTFWKETDWLDEFFRRCIGSKDHFKSLRKLFQIVLILSHGQAHVECGFAERIVHDHMLSHNIKPYQIEISSRMMELAKNARKSYFLELKEKGLKKLETIVDAQQEKLNEELAKFSC